MNPFELERKRLTRIGSTKDPVMFQTKRKFVFDESTQNRTIIINFTTEDNRFGCRFNCRFCSWKEKAIEIGNIVPSLDAIDRFLSNFDGYKVTLSGGGDPLFDLATNGEKLLDIIHHIHRRGFLVEIITKELNLVSDACKTYDNEQIEKSFIHQIIREVDSWSFSIESSSSKVMTKLMQITSGLNNLPNDHLAVGVLNPKRLVRVSKVFLNGSNVSYLKDYIHDICYTGISKILIREDFNKPINPKDYANVQNVIKQYGPIVRFLRTVECSNNLFLINETISTGTESLGG
jgi:hypothetical protein